MTPESEPSFEQAIEQLEAIVGELERGAPELSAALTQYEQGVRLLARCQQLLEGAERSVALLSGIDEAGNPIVAPFDATATAERETAPTKSTRRSASKKATNPSAFPASDGDDELIPF
jgi:exodeoxyribonuclease VII small subunit